MLMRAMRWLALLVLAMLAAPGMAAPPLVLAAASLQESLTDAAAAWARRGHAPPRLSFAASSALARQVMAGAPADLFISADGEWMDALAAKRLIVPGTQVDLLANQLVLVAPVARPVSLAIRPGFPLSRALGNGRLAMADPDAVPAGRYGQAALTKLGVWPAVAPHVARAENVRAAMALVERGAAPLGIVYATDARASRGVMVAGVFPAASHPPIVYPLARLTRGTSPDAEGFRAFLTSPAGRAIFVRHGFTVPRPR